jgi:hypothetical protein
VELFSFADRAKLLRVLIADLNAPAEADAEEALRRGLSRMLRTVNNVRVLWANSRTDVGAGFLASDPLFTAEFRAILGGGGVTPVRMSAKSRDLNAYPERFVRSIRDECLNRVPLGERHLPLYIILSDSDEPSRIRL